MDETRAPLLDEAPADLFSPAEVFHEASKLQPTDIDLFLTIRMVSGSPDIRRVISRPAARCTGLPAIDLPAPAGLADVSVGEAIRRRRSRREMSGQAVGLDEIATLLYAAAGVVTHSTDPADGTTWGLRTTPSGGGLYPVEVYCCALDVAGLPNGVYGYLPASHQIAQLYPGSTRAALDTALSLPDIADTAAACIVLSGVPRRTAFKYGERGYRFELLECGHACQNLLLAAAALDLAAVPIGGFLDDVLNDVLRVDGLTEHALYAIPVGRPAAD
ncbi:MAG TPA: SagB/ThcOx family dehydrogenase [Mycobacteriales bacterium]|jgi:SagB-type dehydrogenase family enzyme